MVSGRSGTCWQRETMVGKQQFGIGRQHDQHHVVGRLFQRFEQGVLRFDGGGFKLIEDRHAVAAFDGTQREIVLQGADLIDLDARAVGFDQLHVGMFARVDELARSALAARSGRVSRSAVEGQRQRSRQRGLADLRRAADQIGVRGSIIRDGAIETEDGPVVSDDRPVGRGHAGIIAMNNTHK